ncbi:hypothetical protein C8R42DRAFT_673467 [Lentinula raphanica]|nr:hypothetical protein C8R42DRAFT_673467 [Lentinula raphanica]
MAATSHTWDLTRSPFVELLGTNHAPSPDKLNELRTLLIEPFAELERLETEIARALNEKEKINNFIEAHRALMSPVRQIPEEVLAEIFVHCLPTERNAVRSLDEAPLLLTTICRDWRRVALDIPRLWRTLHISIPPHLSDQVMSRRAAGIRTWLGRSGTLPLSISFHAQSPSAQYLSTTATIPAPVNATDHLKSLISALASFSPRFGDLCLSLPITHLKLFDELSGPHFPILHTFRVPGGRPQTVEENACIRSLLNRAAVLRRLEISSGLYAGAGSYLSSAIDWALLVDLSLHRRGHPGLIPSEALEVIRRTPNLQNLYICFTLYVEEHPLGSGKMMLSHLVNLRFEFSYSSLELDSNAAIFNALRLQTTSIFQSLCLPSLKLLSVSGFSNCGGRIIDLKSIYDTSSDIPFHHLETLELDLEMTPKELHECLSSAPELVSLHVKNKPGSMPCFSDSHFSGLTCSHGTSSPLCPKLAMAIRVFYMSSAYDTNIITSSSILSFARSRAKMLKILDVYFAQDPAFAEEDLVALRKLKEDGLKLRLHSAAEPLAQQDSPLFGLPSIVPVSQLHSIRRPGGNQCQKLDMEGYYGTNYIV